MNQGWISMRRAPVITTIIFCATAFPGLAASLFSEDFENPAAGWQYDSLWHLTTGSSVVPCRHSGSSAAGYFDERTGTYETGSANSGSLTSPGITLTAYAVLQLTFWE
jgi:hypothetical protein